MTAMWEILPQSSLPRSIPSLLVSFRSDSAGYTIHLTDLTYIWSESLDNEQIVQRTLVEETSIEPKEDPGQLRVLLMKIQQGLQGSDESNLKLLREGDEKHLLLRVSARLPPPFRPLQWPIHLTLMAQEALRAELLVPLLVHQVALKQQVASLLAHIKEKDNVIMKLIDKLESSGIDLTMIFPGAAGVKAGKKGLGRERAAKVVQGLADFNDDSWRKEMAKAHIPSGDENGLLSSILAADLPTSKNIIREPRLNAWWYNLEGKTDETSNNPDLLIANNQEHLLPNAQESIQENVCESAEFEIDEEFERQVTPPSLQRIDFSRTPEALEPSTNDQSIPQKSIRAPSEGATTDGEENLDAPRRQSAYPKGAPADESVLGENLYAASISGCQNAAPQNTTPRSKKLGLIGGRTHANVADAQGERNKSYQDAQRGKTPGSDTRSDGLETPSPGAREVAVDNHHEEAPQRSAILTSTSKKARGRFGVIGGKKKNSEGKILDTHPEAALSPSPHYRPNSEQGNEEKPKISPERATLHDEELGELPSKYSDPTMVRGSPKSISRNESTLQRPATPPAENSQDRADKKRVELKRLLDEKAKAPTVKKRKF